MDKTTTITEAIRNIGFKLTLGRKNGFYQCLIVSDTNSEVSFYSQGADHENCILDCYVWVERWFSQNRAE